METQSDLKCKIHSDKYCISPGGGRAGKIIQKSKDAYQKDHNNVQGSSTAKSINSNGKIAINIGKAFIVYVSPCDISTPDIEAEFTGLASDLPDSILLDTMENIEWSSWLALEEVPKISLDCG